MASYLGFVPLGSPLTSKVLMRNASLTPFDPTGSPSFRVYGPAGLMQNGTGSLTPPANAAITGATNATPIVITSSGHGLNTGTRVTIASVVGNTAANGSWNITRINANTFSLDTSVGNGVYTSGGTWHVSGLYDFTLTPIGADGYVQGANYTVLVTAVVDGITKADTFNFTCV